MKLTFTTVLIIGSLLQSLGQERTNREKLRLNTKSDSILKAVGWAYNTALGEWVDYENVISDSKDYKDKYKSLQGAYMMSHLSQNFQKLQIKTITFKGTIYYVLMVEKWSGEYEYPNIQEGWSQFKQTVGYIESPHKLRR